MRIGKLDNDKLETLILNKFKNRRAEVFSSPKVGVDCAKLSLPNGIAMLSTDPITAAVGNIGYLTVHVNCNDAASAGAEPIGLLVTLLCPPSCSENELEKIAKDIETAAENANVAIIGGHTEVTSAVNQIITSAAVIATPVAKMDNLCTPGSSIIMTKSAGIEGTFVLASDFKNSPKLSFLNETEINTALAYDKKLSVIKEGIFAAKNGAKMMHDITEGGVFGALWEMAYASKAGLIIDKESIEISDITRKLCEKLYIDPYRLLSSGSLLICCENTDTEKIISGLLSLGIDAKIIATVTEKDKGIKLKTGETVLPPKADELYSIIEKLNGEVKP